MVFSLLFFCFFFCITPEYQSLWVSGIQMVNSCDLADHLNNRHLDHKQAFYVQF